MGAPAAPVASPLLLVAVASGSTKLAILWLFRWERRSGLAAHKRLPALVAQR